MRSHRWYALLGAGAVLAWYAGIFVFWAIKPLHDAVPVGIDYTKTPPAAVTIAVTCATLFSAGPLDGSLPTLTPQPSDKPPLAYAYPPCAGVHGEARGLLIVDSAVALAGLTFCAWAARRGRTTAPR